jgi:D-lyxose ketol-isomerase
MTDTEPDFVPGQRVQLHPGTDRWMMADKYGVVVEIVSSKVIRVKLDRSGRTLRFRPDDRLTN